MSERPVPPLAPLKPRMPSRPDPAERIHSIRRVDGSQGLELRGATLGKALAAHLAENKDLSGLDLSEADLSGLDLSNARLDGAKLAGANLRGAIATRASFNGCDMSGVQAPGLMDGRRADLHGSNLGGAYFGGATFKEATLGGANLASADLQRAKFEDCDLASANLARVALHGTVLRRNDLSKAIFGKSPRTPLWGVARRDRARDTVAIGNRYDKDTHLDDTVPALQADRRRTARTDWTTGKVAGWTGIGVVGGVSIAADKLSEKVDWQGLGAKAATAAHVAADAAATTGHAIGHAIDGTPLSYVDWLRLAEGLNSLVCAASPITLAAPYAKAAVHGLQGWSVTAPAVDFVAAHPAATAVIVAGIAWKLAGGFAKSWLTDKLKPELRGIVDKIRPAFESAARRLGNARDLVGAFMTDTPGARLLVRALKETNPEGRGRRGTPIETASAGDVTLVVCKGTHLHDALEWIQTSYDRSERLDHDVILVRSGKGENGPSALKFFANGGMTAFWGSGADITSRTWDAAAMAEARRKVYPDPEGAYGVRRQFENAILRDANPDMPILYDARYATAEFRDEGKVMRIHAHSSSMDRTYEGEIGKAGRYTERDLEAEQYEAEGPDGPGM